jgi:hypothetical protein
VDGLEFTSKVLEAVLWPISISSAAILGYWNRGKGGKFFGELFKRVREVNVGSLKVVLAESLSPPPLSANVKEARYRQYTNGIIVQNVKLGMQIGMKFTFKYPVAFPNEVLSFQFDGSPPLPVTDVTNSGFVLDATGYPGPLVFDLKITGL